MPSCTMPSMYTWLPSSVVSQGCLFRATILERPILVHFENQDKTTEFGGFFNSQPCNILYYPEEKDEQGQQKRAGHYDLLREVRCQVYSIGDFVAVRAGKSKWYMAIISELDNDTEEVKLNFMEISRSLLSFSDEEKKWVSMSTIIHNAQCLAWMAA